MDTAGDAGDVSTTGGWENATFVVKKPTKMKKEETKKETKSSTVTKALGTDDDANVASTAAAPAAAAAAPPMPAPVPHSMSDAARQTAATAAAPPMPATVSHSVSDAARQTRDAYDTVIQNTDGDDLDDFGSAWALAKASGQGWGGRGFGGRSLKVSGNEHDVSIDSLTLAYDGNTLLNRTKLLLKRGVKYGLIGSNGCGKSTLMRRLARYAIPGFPLGLRVTYVDQELRQFVSLLGRQRGTSSSALDLLIAFTESGAGVGDADNKSALLAEQLKLENIDDPDECTIERLCEIAEILDQLEEGDIQEVRNGCTTVEESPCNNRQAMLKHLQSFGFSEHMATAVPITKLSGGWKMRLALLVAILTEPDILLLDEPTNHLDLDGVLWLQEALRRKSGRATGNHIGGRSGAADFFSRDDLTIVIVSHDRAFLDSIVEEIISFEFKQLTYHPGNYSAFANARNERRTNKQRLLENRAKKLKSVEKMFAKHTQSQSLKRTTKGYDPKKEKQAASQRKKAFERTGCYLESGKRYKKNSLRKIDAKSDLRPTTISADDQDFIDPRALLFKFPMINRTDLRLANAETSTVFSMESVKSLGYGEVGGASYVPILESVTLSVCLSSRIAVVGPNGAGKTTLLKLVGGDSGPVVVNNGPSGSITSHHQLRRALTNQHHVESLETMMELSPVEVMQNCMRATQNKSMNAGDARQLLGGFGLPGELALMPLKLLSGGQKARLSMACAVQNSPHLLAMDEPTNHLDVPSREALIAALGEFNGGIVLVSHDAHFLKQVCNELWIVKGGRVKVVKGNFAEAFDAYCAANRNQIKNNAGRGGRCQHGARGRFDA